MTLHDPEMECTCNGDGCVNSVFLPMGWNTHGYDLSDSRVAVILETDHGWTEKAGKHYCEDCSENNVLNAAKNRMEA